MEGDFRNVKCFHCECPATYTVSTPGALAVSPLCWTCLLDLLIHPYFKHESITVVKIEPGGR